MLYAAVSLYWALGGTALLATVGPQFVGLAERGGAAVILSLLLVAVLKFAGGMLALALVKTWPRRLQRRLLTGAALAGGMVLTLYGGIQVGAGGLALAGVFGPATATDRTALRWHVGVWDLWFLVWGLLLGTAALQRRRLDRRASLPSV